MPRVVSKMDTTQKSLEKLYDELADMQAEGGSNGYTKEFLG